jgi:hypothetical protein
MHEQGRRESFLGPPHTPRFARRTKEFLLFIAVQLLASALSSLARLDCRTSRGGSEIVIFIIHSNYGQTSESERHYGLNRQQNPNNIHEHLNGQLRHISYN